MWFTEIQRILVLSGIKCFETLYFVDSILYSFYIDEIKPISKVDLWGKIKKTVLEYSIYSKETC